METVVNVIFPFFALVGLGYLAAWRGLLAQGGVAGLNGFVFWFALPALLYRTMAAKPLAEILDPAYMGAYAAAGLAVFAASALLGRLLFGVPLGVMGLLGQGAVVGNVGFLGIPLITALMGPEAAVPIGVALVVDLLLMIPLSMAMLEVSRNRAAGGARIAGDLLRAALINPFVLSMAVGMAGSALRIDLPVALDRLLGLLAAATAPCALFAIGASLHGRPIAERFAETVQLSVFKLLVHPAAVFVALFVVVPVDRYWATAALLTAAQPVAGNLFIVAQRFDVYVARSSTAILVSTVAAMVTFSALVALLGL